MVFIVCKPSFVHDSILSAQTCMIGIAHSLQDWLGSHAEPLEEHMLPIRCISIRCISTLDSNFPCTGQPFCVFLQSLQYRVANDADRLKISAAEPLCPSYYHPHNVPLIICNLCILAEPAVLAGRQRGEPGEHAAERGGRIHACAGGRRLLHPGAPALPRRRHLAPPRALCAAAPLSGFSGAFMGLGFRLSGVHL